MLLAFAIPARTQLNPIAFYKNSTGILDRFQAADDPGSEVFSSGQQVAFHELEEQCNAAQPPLQRIEHSLQPWVSLLIMPLFALVNAGVDIRGFSLGALVHPITLGIALGLFIGKPLGITLMSWLFVVTKIAVKPASLSWVQIHGAAWLGGIGFTMSLFISALAFDEENLAGHRESGNHSRLRHCRQCWLVHSDQELVPKKGSRRCLTTGALRGPFTRSRFRSALCSLFGRSLPGAERQDGLRQIRRLFQFPSL